MESDRIAPASKIKNLILEMVFGELKENCMMRNLVIAVVLVLCFSALTVAQELPKFEVYGGWSYIRTDGGGNDMSPTNGWNAQVAINVNEMVGIVVDANGAYRSFTDEGFRSETVLGEDGETLSTVSVPRYRESGSRFISLAFGPRFTFRQHEKYQPFYHAMIGIRHSSSDDFIQALPGLGLDQTDADVPVIEERWISDVTDNFLMIFGGGMDIVVNEKFSVRAFQADYTLEKVSGELVPDLRFGTGLVFKIGEK